MVRRIQRLKCVLLSYDTVTSHRIKCINYDNASFEPVIKFLVYFVGFRKGLNSSELNSSYKLNSQACFIRCITVASNLDQFNSRYVYTLRLIWPISYPGECDLMVHPQKHSVIFSRMSFCYLRTYITCTKIRNRPD